MARFKFVLLSNLKHWMEVVDMKSQDMLDKLRYRYHDNVGVGQISRYRMEEPTERGSSRPNLKRALQIVNILKEIKPDLDFEEVFEIKEVEIIKIKPLTIAQRIANYDAENKNDL